MKYSYVLTFDSGEVIEGVDCFDIYDSKEAAYDGAVYAISCCQEGAEILNMSNPGDYPLDDNDCDPDIEIVEVDE